MDYLDFLYASDGTGEAVRAVVTGTRTSGATTLEVDSLNNWPTKFVATVGTLNESTGIIDPATVTVFKGHSSGGDIVIDQIAPGYVDDGNSVGQVVVLKPNTFWADSVVDMMKISLNPDGTLQRDAIDTAADSEAVGLLANVRTYLNAGSPHTWTKPAGLKFIEVEVVGGGGLGGSFTSGQTGAAGGGGGGGYSYKKIAVASLGATETVTVGAGGQNTSFGSHCSATAGSNGTGTLGTGGAGGEGSNGDINVSGGDGGAGATSDVAVAGGTGGSSRYGGGSRGVPFAQSGDGIAGKVYGGGGGGARAGSSGTARTGGAGAAGICIVREYY